MKTPPAFETELAAVVDKLFRRWPSLVGFSVEARANRLVVAEIESTPWPARPPELLGEIAGALRDLIDVEPGALALLPGRTFARTLH